MSFCYPAKSSQISTLPQKVFLVKKAQELESGCVQLGEQSANRRLSGRCELVNPQQLLVSRLVLSGFVQMSEIKAQSLISPFLCNHFSLDLIFSGLKFLLQSAQDGGLCVDLRSGKDLNDLDEWSE